MPAKKPRRQIFANTTMIHVPPGSAETYLDGAFLGRFYGAMHELLEAEKPNAKDEFEPSDDALGVAVHSRSVETLPDNPLALVKDQHVISREHLSWFRREDGKVCVLERGQPRLKHIYPKNPFFCAPRIWSNHAELWMQKIEREFYKIARRAAAGISNGKHVRIDGATEAGRSDQDVITEYWALCRSRVRVRAHPPRPLNLSGQKRHEYPQAKKDALEYDGFAIYSTEGDETRALATAMVRRLMHMDMVEVKARGCKWRLGVTPDDAVVLPDLFPRFFVPLGHNLLLFGDEEAGEEAPPPGDLQNYVELASQFLAEAKHFLVARSDTPLENLKTGIDGGA